MASFTVDVPPSVLIWARKSAGFSLEEVAKRLDVSPVDVRAWEEGAVDPYFAKLTFARIRTLAAMYRRPVAIFYLEEPPKDFLVPNDYRRVSGAGAEAPSTQLRFELRRLATQRDAAIELAAISQDLPKPIELRIGLDDNPETVGQRIRSWLDVSLDDQMRWSKNPFRYWARALEAKDVLVTQLQGVPIEELRGCSISAEPFPLVAVNQRDAAGGRLFTLLHEVAHLLLGLGGLCDLHENVSQRAPDRDRVERFCNAVAASALMPLASVRQVLGGTTPPKGAWTDQDLKLVATRHGVSQEAALLRLVTLDLAAREEYEQRRQLFLAMSAEARDRMQEREGNVRIPVADRRFWAMGRRFVEEAVGAFEREDITASDLADYLDMKIDHLPRMTELLRTRL